jgi:4-amino-4-deoxy-L-arabinose transferase-like glycosyltransferase
MATQPIVEEAAPAAGAPAQRGGIALLAVIGFGVAVRLAFFAATYHVSGGLAATHTTNGTAMYLRPAMSLYSTGRLAVDGAPELLHPPGYTSLLAAGLWTGHLELVAVAVQLLLAAATIWLIYGITLSWTHRRGAALGAALLAAIEPMSIVFSSLLMTETLFTFLFVLSIQRLLRYLSTQSLAALIQTALLLAVATLVRPVSYYLPTILAAMLLAHALWRSAGLRRAASYAAIFWAVSMAPLVAWQVRNYVETGYSGFAAIADFNLYFFHGASVLAHQHGQSMETVQNEMGLSSRDRFDQLHPELPPNDQAARFRFMHAEGVRLIREDPLSFAKAYLRGVAILIFNPGASEVLDALHCYPKDRPARPANLGLLGIARQMQETAPRLFYSNLLLLAGLATAYLTAALGLASQLRRPSWQLVAMLTLALYLLAVSGGAQCVTRLRHPVMPLVFVLSGIGMAQLAAWWHRLRGGRPATGAMTHSIAGRAAA